VAPEKALSDVDATLDSWRQAGIIAD